MLLDTHALYWFVSRERRLGEEATLAIGDNQSAGRLYVSPISAWELSLAARKPPSKAPPRLDVPAAEWFDDAVAAIGAKVVPIGRTIALEAAEVAWTTGHRDPGDCFLIATARTRRLAMVTRDEAILRLASAGHLDAIRC